MRLTYRPTDVVQGAGRNCAAAAAAAAIVAREPHWPRQPTGVYLGRTVTEVALYAPNRAGVLTLDVYTPKRPQRLRGWWQGALWWRVMERGLARRGWETEPAMAPAGTGLSHAPTCPHGYPNVYMEVFRGQPATLWLTRNLTDKAFANTVRRQWSQGAALCISTHPARLWPSDTPRTLQPEHCYAIVDVRERRGAWQARLYDPRGDTLVSIGRRRVPVHGWRRPFWLSFDDVLHNSAALYAAIPTAPTRNNP